MNHQKPFTFQQENKRNRLNSRASLVQAPISKNIRGICSNCGKRFQKVAKQRILIKVLPNGRSLFKYTDAILPCSACEMPVIELPLELCPWQTRGENYQDHTFQCGKCRKRYFSYSLFGSLCQHKKHAIGSGYAFCRLCCTKKAGNIPKESERVIIQQQLNTLDTHFEFTHRRFDFDASSIFPNVQQMYDTLYRWQPSGVHSGTSVPLTPAPAPREDITVNEPTFDVFLDDDDLDVEEPF